MVGKIRNSSELDARWNKALATNSNGEGLNKISKQELQKLNKGIAKELKAATQRLEEAQHNGSSASVVRALRDKVTALEKSASELTTQLIGLVDTGIANDNFQPELRSAFAGSYELQAFQQANNLQGVIELAAQGPDALKKYIKEMQFNMAVPDDVQMLSTILLGLLGKANGNFDGFETENARGSAQLLVKMGVPVSAGAAKLFRDLGILGEIKVLASAK